MAAEQSPAPRRPRLCRTGWAGAVLVIATLGACTRPFDWRATALIAGVTAALLVPTLRPSTEPAAADPRLRSGLLLWCPLALAVVGWDLFARSRQANWDVPDPAHPTLSTVLDSVLEQGPGRWVGWVVWLALGYWLLKWPAAR